MSKRTEKHVEYKSDYHKRFIEVFRNLTQRYGRFQVWSDFVVMTACAISNAFDMRFTPQREEVYKECASRYGANEIEQIAEMFSMTIMALDNNPEQDFLGDIFGSLNLHNEWHGQFFTPYHIGSMMARMQLPDKPEDLSSEKPITISDPCCGAGCLLIACANEAKRVGINYQEKMVFYAQDIDRIAALMCYIQLSLLGCKAYIKIGNSLTDPLTKNESLDENIWLTPMLAGESIFKLFGLMRDGKEDQDGMEEEIQPDENPNESRQPIEGKVSA